MGCLPCLTSASVLTWHLAPPTPGSTGGKSALGLPAPYNPTPFPAGQVNSSSDLLGLCSHLDHRLRGRGELAPKLGWRLRCPPGTPGPGEGHELKLAKSGGHQEQCVCVSPQEEGR